MRSNQNPSLSSNRSAGTKLDMPRAALPRMTVPEMPMDWLDSGSWRLPSGKALAEFALQAGFLAPLLFRVERLGKSAGSASPAGAAQGRDKNFDRGGSR